MRIFEITDREILPVWNVMYRQRLAAGHTAANRQEDRKMKVYAHRGYSGRYPENTMLAFKKAEETGCYGIELDVQLTKDGEVVIIHDERVDRTTDGTGWVRDYTLAELMRQQSGAVSMDSNRSRPWKNTASG